MTDPRTIARCVLMLAVAAAGADAMAQVIAPSAAASAAAEKAQKETDRTMYWIRVLAATPPAKAPAAPKPAASPAPAPAPRVAAAPERVKVAAATPAQTGTPTPAVVQSSADIANATPAPVVVAAPAAPSPTLASSAGSASAMANGGLEGGVPPAALAGALAAPSASAPQIDIPAPEEEADPGLIMIKSADPEFPISAMRRLRKGEVEVKFEVGPEGVVDVVTVVKTTSPSLNAAAVEAVRHWRFKPTPRGHTAMVQLAFNLDS